MIWVTAPTFWNAAAGPSPMGWRTYSSWEVIPATPTVSPSVCRGAGVSADKMGGDFPDPFVDIAIEPKDKADYGKLSLALGHIAMSDASFRFDTDEESRQTIISGNGELDPPFGGAMAMRA